MVAKKKPVMKKPVKKTPRKQSGKTVNMSGKAKQDEMENAMGVKTKFPPKSKKAAIKAINKKKLPARKK